MSAFDLVELRRRLADPWASADGGPAAIAQVVEDAYALARRAYGQGDVAARHEAENLLYTMNIASAFAPPLDPPAALVWTVLVREKLAALRRELGGCEPLDAAEMRRRLLAAVERWGAYNHPVIKLLRERSDDLAAYRIWAKNWFGSCVGFSAQLAALVQRTNGHAKKVVLENLSDEFDHRVTHDTLRIRFYESLGLRFSVTDAPADPDRVLEATELLNARTALSYLHDPVWALGCFYGVEANWPPECRLHLEINRARGADDHVLEYWTSHATADDHHSAEWLAALENLCTTPERRGAAVEGATIQLRLRWAMYDAIARRIAKGSA